MPEQATDDAPPIDDSVATAFIFSEMARVAARIGGCWTKSLSFVGAFYCFLDTLMDSPMMVSAM